MQTYPNWTLKWLTSDTNSPNDNFFFFILQRLYLFQYFQHLTVKKRKDLYLMSVVLYVLVTVLITRHPSVICQNSAINHVKLAVSVLQIKSYTRADVSIQLNVPQLTVEIFLSMDGDHKLKFTTMILFRSINVEMMLFQELHDWATVEQVEGRNKSFWKMTENVVASKWIHIILKNDNF